MSGNDLQFLREDVRQLSPYTVPSSENGIALQRNEAPYELPDAIRDEILDRIRRASWRRYPDLEQRELRASARRSLGLSDGLDLLFGNGSNELIDCVVTACVSAGSTAVIPQPTFTVYERMVRLAQGEPVFVPPQADLGFDATKILESAAASAARAVFLCRPNNPTGGSMDLRDVERLAENLDALLVVDEAYAEFAGEDAISVAECHNNVLLLRTFSKALCSAGIRIGYAIGAPALLEHIAKTLAPYNLGVMAREAIRVGLARRSELASIHSKLLAERDRLIAQMSACPNATVLPSQTNFICIRTAIPGEQLAARLAGRQIIVRDLSTYPGLANAVRITVGTQAENDRLLDALFKELEE